MFRRNMNQTVRSTAVSQNRGYQAEICLLYHVAADNKELRTGAVLAPYHAVGEPENLAAARIA